MSVKRKKYNEATKFEAVIKMIKGEETIQQLCSHYKVHQSVLQRWKKDFMDNGPNVFKCPKSKTTKDQTPIIEAFERKVGQLTMELDFLKKALEKSV